MKKQQYLFVFAVFFFTTLDVGAMDRVESFVSISPQKWLVEKIGKDLVNIEVLVAKGQDPHTFEPTPKQILALSKATIWFTMEMEFENQLIKKIRQVNPQLHIVDIAHYVDRRQMVDRYLRDGADHHHNLNPHGHAKKHRRHEGSDPHVWLSPVNLQIMAKEVASALARFDRGNRDTYAANRLALHEELAELHQKMSSMLSPFKGMSFYVFHPSFGYFAESYGLKQQAVEMAGKSPSPKQLKKLIEMARLEGVRVVFVQPQFDTKSAKAVASAIGGEVVALDPLEENVFDNLVLMAEKIRTAMSK